MHTKKFICLGQTIPGSVVLLIHVLVQLVTFRIERPSHNQRLTRRPPVSLDRSVGVFQLDVLVTHQRPSGQIGPVELHCSFEVPDSLLVFRPQRIVVSCSMVRHVSSPWLHPH